jgi:DNA (cytosine-5)-methyltransferase 1
MTYKIIDCFAGIGGISKGFHDASTEFETVAFIERDPYANKVLQKNFPNVKIYNDIFEVDNERLKKDGTITDGDRIILTGGIPCQPWSVAGKKKREKDERHLTPRFIELVRSVRPELVLIENVQGYLNQEMGQQLAVTSLEDQGYQTRTFLLPACGVQAPHQRYRCFIIGHRDVSNA